MQVQYPSKPSSSSAFSFSSTSPRTAKPFPHHRHHPLPQELCPPFSIEHNPPHDEKANVIQVASHGGTTQYLYHRSESRLKHTSAPFSPFCRTHSSQSSMRDSSDEMLKYIKTSVGITTSEKATTLMNIQGRTPIRRRLSFYSQAWPSLAEAGNAHFRCNFLRRELMNDD